MAFCETGREGRKSTSPFEKEEASEQPSTTYENAPDDILLMKIKIADLQEIIHYHERQNDEMRVHYEEALKECEAVIAKERERREQAEQEIKNMRKATGENFRRLEKIDNQIRMHDYSSNHMAEMLKTKNILENQIKLMQEALNGKDKLIEALTLARNLINNLNTHIAIYEQQINDLIGTNSKNLIINPNNTFKLSPDAKFPW